LLPPLHLSAWQRVRSYTLPLAAVIAVPIVAFLLVWRRPDLGTAWAFLWFATLQGLCAIFDLYRFPQQSLGGTFKLYLQFYHGLTFFYPAGFLHFMTVFPRPRWRGRGPVRSWWFWLVVASYVVAPLIFPLAGAVHRSADELFAWFNVTALVRLTRAALPGMTSRRKGTIVNVSSMASFQPNPYVASYGASKAYVTNFTEALSAELYGSGVFLQALCPGPVHTEFGEVAGLQKDSLPSFVFATPAQVVDASLRGVERGEVVCVPGTVESLLASVIDVLPRWLVRRASRGLTRRYLSAETLKPAFTEY